MEVSDPISFVKVLRTNKTYPQGDYDQSRLLWLRLPAEVRKHAELQSLWSIGKAMIRSEYSTIYSTTSPFTDYIVSRYRERTIKDIALVYTSISVEELGSRLGYSETQLPQSISHVGWRVAGGWVTPVKPVSEKQGDLKLKLAELASYVSFLENI